MSTETQTQSIKALIRRERIRIRCEWADVNHNAPDWKDATHYKVTLLRGPRPDANGRQLTTYFSMGLAHTSEPTAEDVLDCLASDAAGIENARSFEEWASEYGYDTDSRKAERLYKVCLAQTEKLKRFMGDTYEELLYETERL